MNEEIRRYDRATSALGLGSVIIAGYILLPMPNVLNFVHSNALGALVLAVFGALGIVGGVRHIGAPAAISGGGMLVAALWQLVALVAAPLRVFGGDASLLAVFGAVGIGFVLIALARRAALGVHTDSASHSTPNPHPATGVPGT